MSFANVVYIDAAPEVGEGGIVGLQAAAEADPLAAVFVRSVAEEVARLLRQEFARLSAPAVQPALLNVKEAAVYLGRSEQAVQHMIFDKDIPVVRFGRRVHLHRADLDRFIEQNKY